MPGISRGQENTESIINWFITVSGVLTDAYSVGFRILDITGGLPGTQVFPTTGYEEVVGSSGNFSVGSYYAYDVSEAAGWTPTLTQSIGTHRVEWRWKISSGAEYQASYEDFEVLVQSAGSSTDTYISIDDVHDAGIPTEANDGPTDLQILTQIEIWQAFLDRACRQWFIPKALTFRVDGTDSTMLSFGVPIISIDYVKLNDSTEELEEKYYKVYSGSTYPDKRRNPKIKLIEDQVRDIYSFGSWVSSLKFRRGVQNQEIKGVFGFVEEDGTVPKLIQRALLKLVVEKLTNPVVPGSGPDAMPPPPPIMAGLIEEWTDGHKLKYSQTISTKKYGLSGMTRDQEVLDIIRLYRAPIGIATPSHPSIN